MSPAKPMRLVKSHFTYNTLRQSISSLTPDEGMRLLVFDDAGICVFTAMRGISIIFKITR